jgi:hypothetical protein
MLCEGELCEGEQAYPSQQNTPSPTRIYLTHLLGGPASVGR